MNTKNSTKEGFVAFHGYKTLVMSGRHDEATPAVTELVHRGIPGSERVIFENSSHMPHLEETQRCIEVLNDFLDHVEAHT